MNFFQQRKQRQEIERKIETRRGKKAVEQHIQRQKRNIQHYWGLAKRAARLQDQVMFKQIAKFILASQRDVTQWERKLLYFDMMQARRDQIGASAEFAQAYQAMAKSMLANSSPADMAKIQQDIEMGLAQAEMMDEMLSSLMDISEDMLDDISADVQDGELAQIMQAIQSEAQQEGEGVSDADIEASLRAIEEQLGRG
ncbi:MAG: hypothetical protein KJZ86_03340 [Caldilineaceae bacterium]|nr:hypothetical protein [Caldilineaceae bacterium]